MAIKKRKKARTTRKRAVKVARRRVTRRKKASKARNRHRPVVYSFGSKKKRVLRRSPFARLMPRKVNPKKRRRIKRRRNPANFLKSYTKKIFNKDIFMNAILMLVGIGGSASLKSMTGKIVPATGIVRTLFERAFGVAAIGLGITLKSASKRKETNVVGTGMIAHGVYDLITSNIPKLRGYLPSITAPSSMSGVSYGRRVMGASLNRSTYPGYTEIVGAANISAGVMPDIVGGDIDLADMLDMSC